MFDHVCSASCCLSVETFSSNSVEGLYSEWRKRQMSGDHLLFHFPRLRLDLQGYRRNLWVFDHLCSGDHRQTKQCEKEKTLTNIVSLRVSRRIFSTSAKCPASIILSASSSTRNRRLFISFAKLSSYMRRQLSQFSNEGYYKYDLRPALCPIVFLE